MQNGEEKITKTEQLAKYRIAKESTFIMPGAYATRLERGGCAAEGELSLVITEMKFSRAECFDLYTFYQTQPNTEGIDMTVKLVDSSGHVVIGRHVPLMLTFNGDTARKKTKRGELPQIVYDTRACRIDPTTGTCTINFRLTRAMKKVWFDVCAVDGLVARDIKYNCRCGPFEAKSKDAKVDALVTTIRCSIGCLLCDDEAPFDETESTRKSHDISTFESCQKYPTRHCTSKRRRVSSTSQSVPSVCHYEDLVWHMGEAEELLSKELNENRSSFLNDELATLHMYSKM